jgi:putative transport protein
LDVLRDTLAGSEPLLLFSVIALGFLLGEVRIRTFRLGVSGVLFVGLFAGAWHGEGDVPLAVAPQLAQVGLILFVYAVGLTSGPGFFDSFRRRGLQFNVAVCASLVAAAAVAWGAGRGLGLTPGQVAGLYCGALTNTPALAAATELAKELPGLDPGAPAVGYSLAYPFGIIGALLAFECFARLRRRALQAEIAAAASAADATVRPVSANFEVRNPALFGQAIGALRVRDTAGVVISRHRHADVLAIPTKYSVLHEGDVVVAVGTAEAMRQAEAYFGARSREHLEHVNDRIVMRRTLVSRRELAGRRLGDLELERRFNAQVTRLRRADIDFVPTEDTTLELGDRLRVVMPADQSAEVTAYFGDSERSIAELDYTALTLGIALGVLLGLVPLPLPGGARIALGFAGGPLVAGLLLGRLGRTGPLLWALPLEANQAIRHIGLLIFLAGVGLMAGGQFLDTLSGAGPRVLLVGALTTVVASGVALFLLHAWAGAPAVATLGATSGMQTQPATLAKAHELAASDEIYVAYATTYPVAMVGKILLAQALLLWG